MHWDLNFGYFARMRLQQDIPKDMEDVVSELKKCKSKEECLKKTWKILKKRFYGCHILEHVLELFIHDMFKIWPIRKQHCTNISLIMRILLVRSGFFKDTDFKIGLTSIWYFSPHQYLKLKMNSHWIDVDPWAANHGFKLGEYAHGFCKFW